MIRHEVPIAIRALRTANIYEVFADRHILVDTGMSPASLAFLEEKGVDLASLDMVLMTHLHIDHIGGAEAIRNKYGTPLAIGREDGKRVEFISEDPERFRHFLMSNLKLNGTPDSILNGIVGKHSVLDNVGIYHDIRFDQEFTGGEKLGGATVISNPGHSPGSVSVLLNDTRKLLTGDHLLPGITPNISFYDEDVDILGQYISSLKETRELAATEILPGHREPFCDADTRISEILVHHTDRLNEILLATKEWNDSFKVASNIRWSKGRTLDSMNLMEMNFAIGEAVTHLIHLQQQGFVERRELHGVIEYRSNGHSVRNL